MGEYLAIKALDNWEIDVLAVPYGRDGHKQSFTENTNLHLDKFPTPVVHYYHGFTPDGKPQGDPVIVGNVKSHERRSDGVWYRIVLDKTKGLAKRIWEGAKKGITRASTGTVAHLMRPLPTRGKPTPGEITNWPVAEIALWDLGEDRSPPANNFAVALPVMKAAYKAAGIDLPEIEPATEPATETDNPARGEKMSTKEEIQELVNEGVQAGIKAFADAQAAEVEAEAKRQAEIDEAVKAAEEAKDEEFEAFKAEAAKGRRLPSGPGKAPYVAKSPELWKYDNLSLEDQAVMIGVLNANDGQIDGFKYSRATGAAVKALAVKLIEGSKSQDDFSRRIGIAGVSSMKSLGIKADEIQQQDLTNFGDEWVAAAYSNALWEKIRTGTAVVAKIPTIPIPPGHESVNIPLESGDPVWYKVAEATDEGTSGWPDATITSSQVGTAEKTLTLVKMGARLLWSGELNEDSIIPWVPQLRRQLVISGAEQLEHAVIDGDATTTATTNINDIAATGAQGGSELYLLFNGFRKSPLVTTAVNSRDGGVLTESDFLETVKLMGTAGQNSADVTKTSFILDPNVYWKALDMSILKTKDVWTRATLEGSALTGLWGYEVLRSYFMQFKSSVRKANSAGKVDQDTVGNNTKGAFLAVRWDQWMIGFRRQMTIETTRIARADTTEIVALARLGLVQRDTEASAITFNLTI